VLAEVGYAGRSPDVRDRVRHRVVARTSVEVAQIESPRPLRSRYAGGLVLVLVAL